MIPVSSGWGRASGKIVPKMNVKSDWDKKTDTISSELLFEKDAIIDSLRK